MPVDSNGNRADIVVGAETTFARMNLGRLYEHYISGAIRDVTGRIRHSFQASSISKEKLETLDTVLINQNYEYLMRFYSLISSRQYNFFANLSQEKKYQHLTDVINDGVTIYLPIDNDKDIIDIIKDLEVHFKPTYGPVTYVGNSGIKVLTKNNVRIAPLYTLLLDKTADDWSSVSTGKLQHFGVLSPRTKTEKFAHPYRNSPVRTIGETEGRIYAGYCGREAIAEMMDRSNSPLTQRNIVWNILNSDKPTNIDHVVDRNHIKLGNSRPLSLINHIMSCAGFKPTYEKED